MIRDVEGNAAALDGDEERSAGRNSVTKCMLLESATLRASLSLSLAAASRR
jgi:hypothetical protein